MRKLYLLHLLFFFVLISCKDDAVPMPINEQILGKWQEATIVRHYYDEGNQELHKETHVALTAMYDFGFDSFSMNMGSTVPQNYSLQAENGKYYIIIERSPIDRQELKISGDEMTWYWEYPHTAYYDLGTNTQKPAHRETVRLMFQRVK